MKYIDCDTHPMLPDDGECLKPYLSKAMLHRFENRVLSPPSPFPSSRYSNLGGPLLRVDARPPGGGLPASDPEFMRDDYLDKHDVLAVLMLSIQAAGVSIWTDPREATALASAFNDFFLEHWYGFDDRYRLAAIVAPQDPHGAAAEVRRIGDLDGVGAVWIPWIDTLLGNAFFYPIYEAAAEANLNIVVHPTGTEAMFQGAPTFASGLPTSYSERWVDLMQFGQAHLSSLVFEGVLERFSNIRFAFTECGWTWLPAALWRMDTVWKAMRADTPWVVKPPSEYVRDRVRFTTQPVDEPPNQRVVLGQIAEMMFAEDVLMFSSDYPHWDGDDPERIIKELPSEIGDAVFYANAAETYGARLGVAAG